MPGWTAVSGPHCVKIGMPFARRVRPGGAMVGCPAGRYRGRVPCVRMRVRLHPGAPGHAPAPVIAWPRAVRASSRAPPASPPGRRTTGGCPERAERAREEGQEAVSVPREVRTVFRVFCGCPPVAREALSSQAAVRCAIDPQVAQHLRRCAAVAHEIRGVTEQATEGEDEGASVPFRSHVGVPNLFETDLAARN